MGLDTAHAVEVIGHSLLVEVESEHFQEKLVVETKRIRLVGDLHSLSTEEMVGRVFVIGGVVELVVLVHLPSSVDPLGDTLGKDVLTGQLEVHVVLARLLELRVRVGRLIELVVMGGATVASTESADGLGHH